MTEKNRQERIAKMDTEIPRPRLLLDGAAATNLSFDGMPKDGCTEEWMLSHSNEVEKLIGSYAGAGSDILYAPTFSANRARLSRFGRQGQVAEINRRLVEITRAVSGGKRVAGDLSPTMLSVEPYGETPYEELVAIYDEQAHALAEAGVDLFVIETMLSLNEARAALLACRKYGKPVYVTMVLNEHGTIFSGAHPLACLITLQELGAAAFGFNCSSDFSVLEEALREVAPFAKIPLISKPSVERGNPLLPERKGIAPGEFAEKAEKLLAAGAGIIGGCCGTAPEHIAALRSLLDGYEGNILPEQKEEYDILLTNEKEVFKLDNDRIEFTGHVKCEFDMADDLLAAEQDSYDVLLIDVDTPEEAYEFSQNAHLATLPVCLHSENEEALALALFLYNGRCMVDKDVSLPQETLRRLSDEYGAVLY